jgi:hypothetical protein
MEFIKFWDDEVVQGHIGSEVQMMQDYFEKNNIKKINYLDIGANVGKFYDLFIQRGFEIDNVIMVEPSHDLFDYMSIKFKDTSNCQLYNLAVSDKDGITRFESHIETYKDRKPGDRSINLGLSKLSNEGKEVELISGKRLFETYVEPFKDVIHFVKIDTENQDYFILESIIEYVKNMTNKPYFLIEHNYHNDMSYERAKNIYDRFRIECGYDGIEFDDLGGSVYLEPKK